MIDDFVEQHHFLGNAVARIIHEHVAGLATRRVTPEATPAELEKLFDEPLPEKGIALEAIFQRFRDDIAPNAMGVPSPRYFGQFNPTPLPIGVWADALSFDAQSERRRMAQWPNVRNDRSTRDSLALRSAGLWPGEFWHARERRFRSQSDRIEVRARQRRSEYQGSWCANSARATWLSTLQSNVTFRSTRALDILGLGRESLRKIPTDDRFPHPRDALREAIERDREAGLLPCCIVGIAGTTSTGVIDPLEELAAIARENRLLVSR